MLESRKTDPLILALDIATKTGWAIGRPSMQIPSSGSIRFGQFHSEQQDIFGQAIKWFSNFLRDMPVVPDILIVEAMLPPDAMRGQTSRAVRDRLAGLHGTMLGVAQLRGVAEFASASVGDVRAHFIGDRTCKREQAKREVILQCNAQGWNADDHNQADACALWSYACSLIWPELALRVMPLFHRRSA